MEVRCYDCGRMVPQGEAIRQNEGTGNVGGVGYGHRSGLRWRRRELKKRREKLLIMHSL